MNKIYLTTLAVALLACVILGAQSYASTPSPLPSANIDPGVPVRQKATAAAWGPSAGGFSLGIIAPATATIGGTITIAAELRNDRSTSVAITPLGPTHYTFEVFDAAGASIETRYTFEHLLGGTALSGGDEVFPGAVESINLHLNHYVIFPHPGKYTVTAVAHVFPAKGLVPATLVRSNSVVITVTP